MSVSTSCRDLLCHTTEKIKSSERVSKTGEPGFAFSRSQLIRETMNTKADLEATLEAATEWDVYRRRIKTHPCTITCLFVSSRDFHDTIFEE